MWPGLFVYIHWVVSTLLWLAGWLADCTIGLSFSACWFYDVQDYIHICTFLMVKQIYTTQCGSDLHSSDMQSSLYVPYIFRLWDFHILKIIISTQAHGKKWKIKKKKIQTHSKDLFMKVNSLHITILCVWRNR